MKNIIYFQPELSQPLIEVKGNKDYRDFRKLLERIDEIIRVTNLDNDLIHYLIEKMRIEKQHRLKKLNKQIQDLTQEEYEKTVLKAQRAFRCNIVLRLKNYPFRVMAERLADSPLLQRFCLLNSLDRIKVPSKSELQRHSVLFPTELVKKITDQLNNDLLKNNKFNELNLANEIDFDDIFIDTTCLKAFIHFPVDWVLLRDATKTLMKGVLLIRKVGLKNRMNEPESFVREMNKLSIKMTHCRNRSTQKKEKKETLRLMSQLIKKIKKHALKHLQILEGEWKKTNLSEKQMLQIKKRMDNVLLQLPQAEHQARERIIGRRQVPNKDKILSLYDNDLHVCLRGKAGAAVEFGNTLVLAEQDDGLIIDWYLHKEQSPGDPKILKQSISRINESIHLSGKVKSITTDRGMDSQSNRNFLEKNNIINFMCPRSPKKLIEQLSDIEFCNHQKRRAQTEGRIGILKNNFLGDPLKSKGFKNRQFAVAWAVLAHNLWIAGRLTQNKSQEQDDPLMQFIA